MSDVKKKSKNKLKLSIKIQKKKVFRPTEPLLSIFMWGINYSVSNFNPFFSDIKSK
jgi:hypothetical protein